MNPAPYLTPLNADCKEGDIPPNTVAPTSAIARTAGLTLTRPSIIPPRRIVSKGNRGEERPKRDAGETGNFCRIPPL